MITFGELNENDIIDYGGIIARVRIEKNVMLNPSFRIMTDDGTYKPQFVFDDYIKGIELTEEILEANGFKRGEDISEEEPYDLDEDGNAYYHLGDDYGIDVPHLWGWYKDGILTFPTNFASWIHVRYVHELQRLMRTVGLVDEANKFKVENKWIKNGDNRA